jgi:mannitol-1-phosphate 5-dehydrogenase
MKSTGSKFMASRKRIIIFGAGKIGRSFIGQLFGTSGYDVVFIDVDQVLVSELQKRGQYRVLIKDRHPHVITVTKVSAVSGLDIPRAKEEIARADIIAVSVGKNALPKVLPTIAKGIEYRFKNRNLLEPLDIILAENMRSAADFVRNELTTLLPDDFPVSEKIGLIETSIGKMVPIMTDNDMKEDPLQVFAEAYNTLILDKRGFRNAIPEVDGLAPKDNIQAWVDRKAFIHNMGHAAVAYIGNFLHPNKKFMYEVLEDPQVLNLAKMAMCQAAEILLKAYPSDFTREDLQMHVDDLLQRFRNKMLKDTVFRVGLDLRRKLGADDRFMSIINMAKKLKMPYDKVLDAMVYGFVFNGEDENGQMFPDDVLFLKECRNDLTGILTEVCGLSNKRDLQSVKEKVRVLQDR